MIDGCTRFQTLRRVMIPLMGPGILTAGIFVFLFAFQEYLTAAILTDINARTVPVFIATQLGQTLPMLQQAGAAAMLLTLPVVGDRVHRPEVPGRRADRGLGQGVTPVAAGAAARDELLAAISGRSCPARSVHGRCSTSRRSTGRSTRCSTSCPPRFALAGLLAGRDRGHGAGPAGAGAGGRRCA